MFIVKASPGAQAPSGAAGYAEAVTSRHMPLPGIVKYSREGWLFALAASLSDRIMCL